MKQFCVFAGTTEGRLLCEFLAEQGAAVTACLATVYGETLLRPMENLTVSTKPMNGAEIQNFLETNQFDLVLDATHPYAATATEQIFGACAAVGIPCLRVLREAGEPAAGAAYVPDIPSAVELVNRDDAPVLLATGSRHLAEFGGIRNFSQRVYARVLPTEQALAACRAAGVSPSRILAMQGPFSQELNLALLRGISAGWMVTKDGGSAGGFEAKAGAALAAGTALVVIGRPPQREGLTFSQALEWLSGRFGFVWKPQVTLVGIGPGGTGAMTAEARQALREADCVIGARRMLETAAVPGQPVYLAYDPEEIAGWISAHPMYRRFAVALSGDPGFYSGAKKLLPRLGDCQIRVLPGLSSLAYLCGKLHCDYETVVSVSFHGRGGSIVPVVRENGRVFALTGGETGVKELCKELTAAGLGEVFVAAGERLSYPEERICQGRARELAELEFAPLSVALIEHPQADRQTAQGLPDQMFLRKSGVPMTKSEVRAVCLSKLGLTERAVCWDIGAGSGSVSIEMALHARKGHVYAVERAAEALELLEENRRRFFVDNLTIVPGTAPAACGGLPAPTHVFLGGSGGGISKNLEYVFARNPVARVVATAVTLESVAALTGCMDRLPLAERETVLIQVSRDKPAGVVHLMTGGNPVHVFTMQGSGGGGA